jgi:hypothetical protein
MTINQTSHSFRLYDVELTKFGRTIVYSDVLFKATKRAFILAYLGDYTQYAYIESYPKSTITYDEEGY